MIVCKQCAFQNLDDDSFCGSCGSFLEWTGEQVVAPAARPRARAAGRTEAEPAQPGPDGAGTRRARAGRGGEGRSRRSPPRRAARMAGVHLVAPLVPAGWPTRRASGRRRTPGAGGPPRPADHQEQAAPPGAPPPATTTTTRPDHQEQAARPARPPDHHHRDPTRTPRSRRPAERTPSGPPGAPPAARPDPPEQAAHHADHQPPAHHHAPRRTTPGPLAARPDHHHAHPARPCAGRPEGATVDAAGLVADNATAPQPRPAATRGPSPATTVAAGEATVGAPVADSRRRRPSRVQPGVVTPGEAVGAGRTGRSR